VNEEEYELATNACEYLDTKARAPRWRNMPDHMNHPRGSHSVVALQGRIFAVSHYIES